MSETTEDRNLCEPLHSPKWFAVYTATHHEKCVFGRLTECGVESFLPSYKVRRHWKKRPSVNLDLPLFPNYVFVRIVREQRSTVFDTPGVYSIVGSSQHSWELPEQEIAALRSGVQGRKVEPYPYLCIGERARVVSGALAGLEGIILRRSNDLRIVLSLDQIMKSVAIEVDASELEPASTLRSGIVGSTFPGQHRCVPTVPSLMN